MPLACMTVPVRPDRRLIDYYQSPSFAEDHAYLIRRDPLAAEQHRHAIIDSLLDNLAALGITATSVQLEVQAKFIAGDMSLDQMLEHIELYVASIALRWPE